MATKQELEGAFLEGERYLASNGKAVSCWGGEGRNLCSDSRKSLRTREQKEEEDR